MTKKPSQNPARKPRSLKLASNGATAKATSSSQKASNSENLRKPRASKKLADVQITPLPDEATLGALEVPAPPKHKRRFPFATIMLIALGGLISLALGLWLENLIASLFDRQQWLGWVALSLAAIVALGLFSFLLREVWAVSRLNTLSNLRGRAEKIFAGEEPDRAEGLIATLSAVYATRPDMANARTSFAALDGQVIDPKDRLGLFEKHYLEPLDQAAKTQIMASAKRVSVVTAMSPRAVIDIGYVLLENTRLIRQISQLYGGRPGITGFWKLTARILGHLAMTGAIAAGDSLIQQFVGHGLAARLSTKIGEGVVNGLLTARIGIAAMDQARPMPFNQCKRPLVRDYFSSLASFNGSGETNDRPEK